MEIIKTDLAPKAIGPYSQAIKVDNFIYTSGQLGIDIKTGLLPSTIEEQTNNAIMNLKAILEAKNYSLADVIKTTVFVHDINDFNTINDIYKNYFISNPARSLVAVKDLPKNALIEIEVVAFKED